MELKCSLSGQISFMLLPVSFPRAEAEMQRARPGLWGRRVCAWSVCVFVRVCARASARVSVGVRRSKQLQEKPFGKRTSSCQPPHLALVIVGGGEGRRKKCVCARVCVRARGSVGGGVRLATRRCSSRLLPHLRQSPCPSAACRRAKPLKGGYL